MVGHYTLRFDNDLVIGRLLHLAHSSHSFILGAFLVASNVGGLQEELGNVGKNQHFDHTIPATFTITAHPPRRPFPICYMASSRFHVIGWSTKSLCHADRI